MSDIQFLFTLGRSSQLADIKVNIIRIIATVGVVFSKQDGLPNADILKASYRCSHTSKIAFVVLREVIFME